MDEQIVNSNNSKISASCLIKPIELYRQTSIFKISHILFGFEKVNLLNLF